MSSPPRLLCGVRWWPSMALLLLAHAVAFHETRRTNNAMDAGKGPSIKDIRKDWGGGGLALEVSK